MKKKRVTTDALEILHHLFYEGKPERLAELEEARVSAEIARTIYKLRTSAKLSQRELAALVGTSTSVISRLEEDDYEGPSLSMLQRIATALNRRLNIRFLPLNTK
jgi:ribosome-binding protein aMBF1 (putative translation factor)